MTVSFCVIAYNEENALPRLFEDIRNQDYPHSKMEIVLVDAMSTDKTRELMELFAKEDNGFMRVQLLENHKKIQATGWNVAIQAAKNDIIMRMDAHSMIPPTFVSQNVTCIEKGEYVVGGACPSIVEKDTPWTRTLLMAESSMFGSSIATYRKSQRKTYVKSISHGSYRREVFEKVGLFNEYLGRTEDNEIHYRIREAGYRICYNPEIVSYQHVRGSLRKFVKQKYGNGYWVALTSKVCPQCLSLFHFVPFAFVMAIIGTSLLAGMGITIFAKIMWGMYWFLGIAMSFIAVKGKKKSVQQLLLPILFFTLHVSYGVGSVVGFLKLPFWMNEYKEKIGMKKK